jgi:hypothetical protein
MARPADRGARSGGTGRSRIGGGQGQGLRDQALIAHQRLHIEKLTRQIYGQRSERTLRLLDQIECFATADIAGTCIRA